MDKVVAAEGEGFCIEPGFGLLVQTERAVRVSKVACQEGWELADATALITA